MLSPVVVVSDRGFFLRTPLGVLTAYNQISARKISEIFVVNIATICDKERIIGM